MFKKTLTMNPIINYPLSGDYSLNKESKEFYGDAEKAYDVIDEKVKKSFLISRQSAGKIKFILGLIYFFSLVYFSIKLFAKQKKKYK